MTLQLSKTTILSIVALVFAVMLVYAAQTSAASFGFEKNTHNRKSADAEGVAGCMQSCQDMLAGLGEMNSDSKNYPRQQEKITAKAEQCVAMNVLVAGSPFTEADILKSCGLAAPRCVEILDGSLHLGICADVSLIGKLGIPQCCSIAGGLHEVEGCGKDAEWVVGVASHFVCYVPNS